MLFSIFTWALFAAQPADMRILVSGANGFIGQMLCTQLLVGKHDVCGAVRRSGVILPRGVSSIVVGEIGSNTDWTRALYGVDVVVHLAARVHVMHERATNPLYAFRQVNVEGTESLACAALEAGVKRLIYVSSIKVNGESTDPNVEFTEVDVPAPQDPYGISKWEAEQALNRIAKNSSLEIVILRPPLVYGPGVSGNFKRLLAWVKSDIPLPLASVYNQRSLVYVGNLVDALITCITHGNAAGKTFLVSDGESISTAKLIQRIAIAMGKTPHLFPMPKTALRLIGKLSGKSAEVSRLVDSLVVSIKNIQTELCWQPPYSLEQGLRVTADWYKQY